MIKNLITYEEIGLLARPCTTDRETAEALIAEAQRVELRPKLGDELYILATNPVKEDRLGTLLEGGQWKTSDGAARLLTGLKTALAYYALAAIIRDGNIHASTYGAVVKDDQHSTDAERDERQRQYRELYAQADSYTAEALEYLRQNPQIFPEYKACGTKKDTTRMTIRIIGK